MLALAAMSCPMYRVCALSSAIDTVNGETSRSAGGAAQVSPVRKRWEIAPEEIQSAVGAPHLFTVEALAPCSGCASAQLPRTAAAPKSLRFSEVVGAA